MMTTAQHDIFRKAGRIGVLLLHGLTGTPREMLSVGARLHKYGFTVFCPVLAGHCGSEEDLLATTWRDWADSAEQAFFHFREQADVIFVGGLSAGALLSLYLADRHPDAVRGIALYSTTLKWDGWSIPKLRFLLPLVLRLPYFGRRYHFMEAFPYGIKNERLRRRVVAGMQSGDTSAAGHSHTPGVIVRELWRLVAAVERRFACIKTPSLIVHADNDDIAGIKRNALHLQRHLAGPTELLRLYDSYHMITVDQERHKVADATADFFRRLLSPGERAELGVSGENDRPPEKDPAEGDMTERRGESLRPGATPA
ncbi:MAG: alpha/beta fold hydrolase [Desulfovibrio sp.]|jgi:carboxylesterase|nr:alpha/beta fold hydrolase [Desulfovibrio sp.]